MPHLIGRAAEQRALQRAYASKNPELIAVYGRRRVGKTFLVHECFKGDICFELTGMHEAPLKVQLRNFQLALTDALGSGLRPAVPEDWLEAFHQLEVYLKGLPRRKRVVFLDELPWLATRRAGFLSAFEHFWNSWASKQSWLTVVVCGSATSWMRQHLLRAKGGLHNRVTRRIRVDPFSLATTEEFLRDQGVGLSRYQIVELYMAMGGVPHYLKEVQRGESAAQSIARLAFGRDGLLRDEFTSLYDSLFEKAERHERVVRALASRPAGLIRSELLSAAGLSSGGTTSTVLDDLEQSGFIACSPQFGRKSREPIYRLVDEYSIFYLKWVESGGKARGMAWQTQRDSARWRAWSGLAFESLCLKHVAQIKQALGIGAVNTEESAWLYRELLPPRSSGKTDVSTRGNVGRGAQIDLLIDRADGCINLCEIKFSEQPFAITKRYAEELRQKVQAFREATETRRTLFLTMITTFGIKKNRYETELVDASVTMDALFS